MRIEHPARRTLDAVQLLLGAGLVASPWFAGFIGEQNATYSAWGSGAAAAIVALAALITQQRWLPWAMGAVALWILSAPWALGFEAVQHAMWSHAGVGAALLAAAVADLAAAHAKPKTNKTA
jgi:predicted MFS family arabinose efflux permease